MNIAIVDDSREDRLQLADVIKKCARESDLFLNVTEYVSGEDFFLKANITVLDVVFLDIYMDELSGMDVAYKLKKIHANCKVVFVTTTTEFAIESYDVRAFYYILKPFQYNDIANVIILLDKAMQKSSRYIKVKVSREWQKVFLEEILYVDYRNHYVQIHTEDSIISTYMKFSEITAMLSGFGEFLSCYRCIIINMNKISKVEDHFFLLSNGEYIPINRKKIKEIKNAYVDYVFGTMEDVDAEIDAGDNGRKD